MPVEVGAATRETPSLTGEVIGETHTGLGRAQAHPLGDQHQRGPVWLWVAVWKTGTQWRVQPSPLLPLGPSPMCSITAQQPELPRPGEHRRLRPLK